MTKAAVRELLTVSEATKLVGWNRDVMYRRIVNGELPKELVIKVGHGRGRIYFRRRPFMAWLGADESSSMQKTS